MGDVSSTDGLKNHNPVAFKQVSELYEVLSRHISPTCRTGPGLASLESFCELYLTILADAKDHARIKIAGAHNGEIWLGFYHPEVDEVAVEVIRKKDRGEYGTQVSRWLLNGPSELLKHDEQWLKRLFSGYAPLVLSG